MVLCCSRQVAIIRRSSLACPGRKRLFATLCQETICRRLRRRNRRPRSKWPPIGGSPWYERCTPFAQLRAGIVGGPRRRVRRGGGAVRAPGRPHAGPGWPGRGRCRGYLGGLGGRRSLRLRPYHLAHVAYFARLVFHALLAASPRVLSAYKSAPDARGSRRLASCEGAGGTRGAPQRPLDHLPELRRQGRTATCLAKSERRFASSDSSRSS
jgi:hypothetical protein